MALQRGKRGRGSPVEGRTIQWRGTSRREWPERMEFEPWPSEPSGSGRGREEQLGTRRAEEERADGKYSHLVVPQSGAEGTVAGMETP